MDRPAGGQPPAGLTNAGDADAAREQVPLPPEIAGLLDAVNAAQRDLDQEDDRLESLRRRTYGDWWKLMKCAYPPDDASANLADVDEVRHFIKTRDLPPLRAAARPSTPAGRRDAALAALRAAVNAAGAGPGARAAGVQFVVGQDAAPRYWQPTEPVVLLVGPAVRSLNRPGTDSPMPCPKVAALSAGAPTEWPTDRLVGWLDALYHAAVGGDPPGLLRWSRQPWSPSLLQWEVEVLPIAAGSNLDPKTGTYAPDFVTASHDLPINAPDLVVRDGRGGVTLAANVYVGQSLLTPQARPALLGRLDYLQLATRRSTTGGSHLRPPEGRERPAQGLRLRLPVPGPERLQRGAAHA